MKRFPGSRLVLCLGAAAVLVCLWATRAETQDPSLAPAYGSVKLKAGFPKDPFIAKVEAGGAVQTNKGGVTAWVDKAPDFRLNYTAGAFALTIYAQSAEDTTLLINLPDGTWVANDDGPNTGLNPLLKFAQPQSGQYDIWVGTLKQGITPPAKLFITELK